MNIEKEYNHVQESRDRDNFPIALEGRILANDEILEDINVADTDILLYEVQALKHLDKNNHFAFIPKEHAQRQKKSKNALLKQMNADTLNEA